MKMINQICHGYLNGLIENFDGQLIGIHIQTDGVLTYSPV